jgi:competence protein ComFC
LSQEDSFLSLVLNFVFPQHCLVCKKQSNWLLCSDCINSLGVCKLPRCSVCSKPLFENAKNLICPLCLSTKRYFTKGFSLFNYKDEKIKLIIESIKYYNRPHLVKLLFHFRQDIKNSIIFNGCDCIVPIPMNRKDIKERGFNQAVLIAKVLSKITNIPVNFNLLEKTRKTKKQVGLNYMQRKNNLTGAFSIQKSSNIKKVVLVDDVFTTGSTINECAKVLKRQNIESVFFTVANTPIGLQ